MDIVNQAKIFAEEKHKHLFRSNKEQKPLIKHLEEVAILTKDAGGTEEQIAAAWLHDAVEDTEITIEEIRELFGNSVADIVDGLTDPSDFSGMPLNQRKQMQAERLLLKSDQVKLVKLCDQISNVQSVLVDPPTEWDSAKSLAYVTGAKAIADKCKGLSAFLDNEFENVFTKTVVKYQKAD